MKNSRRLENLHHLAKSSLVSGRHTKFDVYSIKEDNETVIFQRFKLTHWLRGHPSNLMGENFKSAVSNSFYYQLYSILSSEGMYVRLCVWANDLEKNSNWLPLITKKAFPSLLCPLSSLIAEVLWDCAADNVERYLVFILTPSPFSITARRGWKSERLTSTVSLIQRWPFYLSLTNENNGKVCWEAFQIERSMWRDLLHCPQLATQMW